MKLDKLIHAVAEDAALRRRQGLQPAGGKGDKIFPPTYPGEGRNAPPRHVYERRRVDGANVWCVLVDSVQSQANRIAGRAAITVASAHRRQRRAKLPGYVTEFISVAFMRRLH